MSKVDVALQLTKLWLKKLLLLLLLVLLLLLLLLLLLQQNWLWAHRTYFLYIMHYSSLHTAEILKFPNGMAGLHQWPSIRAASSAHPDRLHGFPGLLPYTSEHIRFLHFSSSFPLFTFWFRVVDYVSFQVDVKVASRVVFIYLFIKYTMRLKSGIIACCGSSRRIAFEKSHWKQSEQKWLRSSKQPLHGRSTDMTRRYQSKRRTYVD